MLLGREPRCRTCRCRRNLLVLLLASKEPKGQSQDGDQRDAADDASNDGADRSAGLVLRLRVWFCRLGDIDDALGGVDAGERPLLGCTARCDLDNGRLVEGNLLFGLAAEVYG